MLLGYAVVGYFRGTDAFAEGVRAAGTVALVTWLVARVKGVPAWPWQYDVGPLVDDTTADQPTQS